MVGREAEASGIAKHGAKLVHAVSCAEVPKFTLVVGGSFGAGNYGMCGRAYSPRFMWMWPNARIGVMGGEQAASVLTQVQMAAAKKAGKPMDKEKVRAVATRHAPHPHLSLPPRPPPRPPATLSYGHLTSPLQMAEFHKVMLQKFDEASSATFATSRIWDDGIIEPAETRQTLALALAAAANAPAQPTKFGVYRM